MNVSFATPLIPDLDPKMEWVYLINETYIGEKCIIPLLEDILTENLLNSLRFEQIIHRRLDEELEHTQLYESVLGDSSIQGTNYCSDLSAYIKELPNLTLRIFAMQAILEGVSLGAISWRMKNAIDSPISAIDRDIYMDEIGHTRFSFQFTNELKELDGVIEKNYFTRVSKEINDIFSRNFNGNVISKVLNDNFSVNIDPLSIQKSMGMRKFSWHSAKTIRRTINEFTERYYRGSYNA